MTASRPTEETIILIRALLTRIFPLPQNARILTIKCQPTAKLAGVPQNEVAVGKVRRRLTAEGFVRL
jgi:hypothetical protein